MTPETLPTGSPKSASAQQPGRRRPAVVSMRALPPVYAAAVPAAGAPLDAEQVLHQLEQLRRHVLLAGVSPGSSIEGLPASGLGRKALEAPPMLEELPGSVNGGDDAGHAAGSEAGARGFPPKTCSCGWDEARMRSLMRDEFRHEMAALRRLRDEVDQLQTASSAGTPPASPAGGQASASKQRGSRCVRRSRSGGPKERAPVASPRERRSSLQQDSFVASNRQDGPAPAEAQQPSQTLLEQAMHHDRQEKMAAVRTDAAPTLSRCGRREAPSKTAASDVKAFQFEYDIGFRIRRDKAHRIHRLKHTDSSSPEHSDNSRRSLSHGKMLMPRNPSACDWADVSVSSEGGEDGVVPRLSARRPAAAALHGGRVAPGGMAPASAASPELLSGIEEGHRNSLDCTAALTDRHSSREDAREDARAGPAVRSCGEPAEDRDSEAKLDALAPSERPELERASSGGRTALDRAGRVPKLERASSVRKRMGADRLVAGKRPPAQFNVT